MAQFAPLYKRLEAEGFVRKVQESSVHHPVAYKVQKTLEAKAKIKEYFVPDLMSIQDFARLVGEGNKTVNTETTNQPPPKRRKQSSLAAGALVCYNDSNMNN